MVGLDQSLARRAQAEAQVQVQVEAQATADAQTQVQTEAQAEARPQVQTEAQGEAQGEARARTQAEARAQAEVQVRAARRRAGVVEAVGSGNLLASRAGTAAARLARAGPCSPVLPGVGDLAKTLASPAGVAGVHARFCFSELDPA
ncbi:MAG: hypothetical protein DLM60_02330 [Pseudonocardiales bacterium]|nr:MAG: hypothetical protein DLM60_02330 [Pseudonocardiales bacterium]